MVLIPALATALFLSCGSGISPGLQPPQNIHMVVCLGDSITEQGEAPGGYVWLLRQYLQKIYPERGLQVHNAGVSGNKSNHMLSRFQKDVLNLHPDLITISVGVNDVWHGFYDNHPRGDGPLGIPLPAYESNVEEMVARGQANGSRVVILSTTVIGEDLENAENRKAAKYNRALQTLSRKHHILYVDVFSTFRRLISDYRASTGGRDLFLTVDGVHLNAEGNKVMAHSILTALGIPPEVTARIKLEVPRN